MPSKVKGSGLPSGTPACPASDSPDGDGTHEDYIKAGKSLRESIGGGVEYSAVSLCTSPARSLGEQKTVEGLQVQFPTPGPTDSDRRPNGNTGSPSLRNAVAHDVHRLVVPGDSSGAHESRGGTAPVGARDGREGHLRVQ